ncbi:MAG: N-6 DNA methylase, partial [Acetobacteraceae bacterium]|nr:N-6 DNA methylase [Acetobacteraceae bacterium]
MRLDLTDCAVSGGVLPDAFLRYQLPELLVRKGLLVAVNGWAEVRRGLRSLRGEAGPVRVANRLLGPLATALGYAAVEPAEAVATREGQEDGGVILRSQEGAYVRAWALGLGTDLEAGRVTGRAYRASAMRRAQRVLLACRERVGLITNGDELRLLLCDWTRQDSWVSVDLTAWRDCVRTPDSLRLLAALAGPRAASVLPELIEVARLSHARVTEVLRVQAREAIEGFLNSVLQETGNRRQALCAERLWANGLILVYRILFILKLESAGLEHGASFTVSSLWRETLSPGRVLAQVVRRVLDHGAETGRLLEGGLRVLFRACRDGLACNEMRVPVLGGALFDDTSLHVLEALTWSERGVAVLLDRLLWTTPKGRERERVLYGPLSVEQLGHVYEALLELEPSIVAGRFLLRAGLGRKTTGSFYTPQSFVRFLVRETLGPLVAERGLAPDLLLSIKVVDPAVGSGHFLVEACRFLGDALYTACCAWDEDPALRGRVIAEVAAYLPSRAVEGRDDGVSEARARAICRRLVAVNCLYGVDRNPLAVELAKVSLWLETH